MTTIKLRRDTAANWTSNNPVLATGEPGLETDTKKLKFGDGSTAWNSLNYATNGGTASGSPAQLSQNLSVNGYNITSSSNGNIIIVPDGTGNIQLTPASGHVTISAVNFPTGTGQNGQVLTTDGSGQASWGSIAPFTFPGGNGTNNQVLQSNGDGTTTWATRTSPIPSQTGNSGKFLTTDGSSTSWASAGGAAPPTAIYRIGGSSYAGWELSGANNNNDPRLKSLHMGWMSDWSKDPYGNSVNWGDSSNLINNSDSKASWKFNQNGFYMIEMFGNMAVKNNGSPIYFGYIYEYTANNDIDSQGTPDMNMEEYCPTTTINGSTYNFIPPYVGFINVTNFNSQKYQWVMYNVGGSIGYYYLKATRLGDAK